VLELGATYIREHTQYTSGNTLWMQGGSADVALETSRHLGVVANVAGNYSGGKNGGSPVGTVTVTIGPRYSWTSGRSRIFVEGMLGMAHGFSGTYPSPAGASSSWYTFASEMGGGFDLQIKHHLSLRLLDAHYVRTTFPNSTTNVQNNLRLGAGIVFRIPVN
jgi:hypothetical protein